MPQDTILVFQMGKVGSKTVINSLEQALPGATIHHLHFLHELDNIEKHIRKSWFFSEAQMEHLAHCREIRKQIEDMPSEQRWKVITLVRDPVAKMISAFFYNIDLNKAKSSYRLLRKRKVIRDLVRQFLETVDINDGAGWFDHQLQPVFGLDVFTEPFPAKRGYHIYNTDKADILLLKLEQLNQCAGEAFHTFLGSENFTLTNVNKAQDASYATIYKKFKENLNLAPELLDQIYSARLPKKFYSEQEIEAFRRKWGKA